MKKSEQISRFDDVVYHAPFQVKNRTATNIAITFRPGDNSSTFTGKAFRPLGTTVMIVMSSEPIKRDARMQIDLRGYRAQLNPTDGTIHWDSAGQAFAFDFGLRPRVGAHGAILDPKRNPTLVDLGIEMQKKRRLYATNQYRPESAPNLPGVFLGFGEKQRPPMEDTYALRLRVAEHMGRSVRSLDSLDPTLLQNMLQTEWHDAFIEPGERGNTTGHVLISRTLCNQWRTALRIYEGSEGLLGHELFNPMEALLSDPIDNPADKILAETPIADMNAVTEDEVAVLEKKMREAIGPMHALLTYEDILGGIVAPHEQLKPSPEYVKSLPHDTLVKLMKKVLPSRYHSTVTSEDFESAINHPESPLMASGMAAIQIINRPLHLGATAFEWSPPKGGYTYVNVSPTAPPRATGKTAEGHDARRMASAVRQ